MVKHLECCEDLGASGGALEASVQERCERPWLVILLVNIVVFTNSIRVLLPLLPMKSFDYKP